MITLRDQINLELDDVYLDYIEEQVKKIFPDLTLDKFVPLEISDQVSDILSKFAK